MESINIKNGIPIYKTKDYCMYHMYFPDTSEFFMCIPNNYYDLYKVIIDITDIDFNQNAIDIDDIVSGKMSNKTDIAYDEYPNCIYIIPKISLQELNDALEENDDRLYKRLLKKIEHHRNNAYWSLANAAIFEDEIHVESQINILKQSDDDVKLFWWIDLNNITGYKQIELHDRLTKKREKMKAAEEAVKMEQEIEALNKKAEEKLEKTEIEALNKKAEEKLQKINAIKEHLRKLAEEEANKTYREITNVIVFEPPKDVPKTKTRKPSGDGIHSTGYSNLAFIITVLMLSFMMGTCLAYLILR